MHLILLFLVERSAASLTLDCPKSYGFFPLFFLSSIHVPTKSFGTKNRQGKATVEDALLGAGDPVTEDAKDELEGESALLGCVFVQSLL